MLFGHAVLLIFCVGLPALFTGIAPVSVVKLTRADGQVTAHVSKHLWLVVPYSRTGIENVTTVGDHFVSGSRSTTRKPGGGSSTTQTEDSAYLTIEGTTGSIRVEVSPVNIKNVLAKTDAFIKDSTSPSLRLITVANWKFGVFAGGILSLLTAFYVYLQLSSLVRWIMRLNRR